MSQVKIKSRYCDDWSVKKTCSLISLLECQCVNLSSKTPTSFSGPDRINIQFWALINVYACPHNCRGLNWSNKTRGDQFVSFSEYIHPFNYSPRHKTKHSTVSRWSWHSHTQTSKPNFAKPKALNFNFISFTISRVLTVFVFLTISGKLAKGLIKLQWRQMKRSRGKSVLRL